MRTIIINQALGLGKDTDESYNKYLRVQKLGEIRITRLTKLGSKQVIKQRYEIRKQAEIHKGNKTITKNEK